MPILNTSPPVYSPLLSTARLTRLSAPSWKSLACTVLTFAALLPGCLHALPTQDSPSPSSDAETEANDQENAESSESATPAAEAPAELPVDLRRWLDEVETLSERGDLKGARQHLSGLITSDVYTALLSSEDVAALVGLYEIIPVAEELSLLGVEGVAREELVRRLAANLDSDDHDLLHAKQDLAVTRRHLGDLAGALELQELVHAARERLLPSDHPELLSAKQNLAVTLSELGDLKGALELEESVHAARERSLSADDPDLLSAKQNLAVTRGQLGDLAGALELKEQVHTARKRLLPADDPDLLSAKQNLAATLSELGDLAGALEHFEFVHATRERSLPPDHPNLLDAKQNLAVTRKKLGDLAGALELEELVLAAWESSLHADHPDLLSAKQNLAGTRFKLGDLAGALKLFESVHAASERLLPPDHPNLLGAKSNLAATRYELGDLAGAAELYEIVHAASERLLPADHPDLLDARLGLATMRYELGDFVGALELEELVHAARERLLTPDHPDLLTAKLNLSATRYELGDLAGALELEEQVHSAWERLLPADHPDLLSAKQSLAVTRYELDDLAGALELEELVHAAWKRLLPSDHPDLLEAKLNLAVTRYELGDVTGALELEEQVITAWERLLPVDHPDLLSAKVNLAATRSELGDWAGALELAGTILQGQIVRAGVLRRDAPRIARASAEMEVYRFSRCLFFTEPKRLKTDSSVSFKLESELFAALESLRSVSIGSPAVMSAATKRPELARMLAERRRVRGALGDLQLSAPGIGAEASEVNAWRSELVRLSEERDSLERDVRHGLAEAGFDEALPSAARVAAGLDSDALLVDFLRYERYEPRDPKTDRTAPSVDSLLAFVVTPAGDVHRVELGPSADAERLVAEWNGRIGRSVGRGFGDPEEGRSDVEVATRLREHLLDPCLAVVGGELPAKLHVILDDFLYLAPFDAMIWKDGKRLGEVCEVRSEVTAQRLTTNAGPYSGDGSFLALGGVDFNAKDVEFPEGLLASAMPPIAESFRTSSGRPGRFSGLEQSRIEVEALEFLFTEMREGKSVVLTGAEASKKALFEGAPSARFLHLATHGWFAPETFPSTRDRREEGDGELSTSFGRAEETLLGFAPETLCGLALAGANDGLNSTGKVPGMITAEELSALDLGNCELAVLSACETNVGIRRAGQGIQSLQTALHAAGVRTAITTLWRVDDAAARRLMELFYTKLWRDEMPKAKALWQAKMEMRAAGFAVKDWAGWVMTGDPR